MNQTIAVEQAKPASGQPDCLFCRFDDKSRNTLMGQSSNFYARMDNYPAAKGHVEIVPKKHVVSFFDMQPSEVEEMYSLMAEIKEKLEEDYQPDGYTIAVNDGRAAGRTVDHLHVHLIPRYKGDVADPRGGVRQIFPDCDPDAWASDLA
jgi:diadenosine tetraphosphate (Ap4A) HIT family hydrolase